MEDINKIKKKRTQVRRIFTKNYKDLEALVNKDEPMSSKNLLEMKALQFTLEEYSNSLLGLDERVEDLLLNEENLNDEDLESEYDSRGEYRSKWHSIKVKCDCIISKAEKREDSVNGEFVNYKPKRNVHLPKLQLPRFDGNVKNWIGFWGQFKKINDDNEIEPEDKFQFLLQSMTQGSSARELIESFPPSRENYYKAVDQLRARYGRDEFLIEVYVRELLHLVLQQATNKSNKPMPLSSLFDKLETQLRALETLGVTTDKYAAMLYPLVESALPDETLRAWERYRASSKLSVSGSVLSLDSANNTINYLQMLLDFLRTEVESEERLSLARSSFRANNAFNNDTTEGGAQKRKFKGHRSSEFNSDVYTASAIVSTEAKPKVSACLFCKKEGHNTQDCIGLHSSSMDEKKHFVVKNNACFQCLRQGHFSKKCKVFVTCFFCNKKKHYGVMCPELERLKSLKNEQNSVLSQPPSTEKSESLLSNQGRETLMQTIMVKVVSQNKSMTVRALLDSGSQKSFISKSCVESLNLRKHGKDVIVHSLFGGVETKAIAHNIYKVDLVDIKNTTKLTVDVLDQDKICNYVPRLSSSMYLPMLSQKKITISDVGDNVPEIQLLLGADVLGFILTGAVERLDEWLVAVETRLGWTIMGQCQSLSRKSTSSLSCFVKLDIPDLWQLDVLGIKDPAETKSKQTLQEEAMKHFKETVTINSENRYEVSLPWLEGHPELQDNRQLAEKRLLSVTKRLLSVGKFQAYDKVFSEWLECGIIEKVSENLPAKSVHYLPHHAVLKDSSLTTKIRPVFDASAADKNGNSLNSCLEKGPNLVELIPPLIMKFRLEAIGVVADIEKAFLQISVSNRDRDFMRFLWWEDHTMKKKVVLRHCRVVFGVSPSPFLLGATLLHHLDNVPDGMGETAEKLKHSFYIDNCIASVPNETKLNKFVSGAQAMLSTAQFNLRGWASNVPISEKVLHKESDINFSQNDVVPVLGLLWDLKDDTLCCNISCVGVATNPLTKRSLLSVSHRIFDPIGFTSPFTLVPKLLLQRVWQLKLRWDDELPSDILREFNKWVEGLQYLKQLRIPRRLTDFLSMHPQFSLHVFSDASKKSYAACIFLRVECEVRVSVQLVAAKSRLAPVKDISIPRLELVAAVIATRLYTQVRSALDLKDCKSYFWTDSMVVLAWLQTKGNWNTFVGNRCKEICQTTSPNDWKHIPGPQNPADLPSRGCSGKDLLMSNWWEGPNWLRKCEDEWPISQPEIPEEDVNMERKKSVVTVISVDEPKFTDAFSHFSSYTKNVRTMGWIMRFCHNCKSWSEKRNTDLDGEELKRAEKLLLKCIQQDMLKNYSASNKLLTFTDDDGLIRVKSKLTYEEDFDDFKCPVLLPHSSEIVQQLIYEKHINNCHAGVQTLMAILRENFWILKCRIEAKRAVSKCFICKRHRIKPLQTPFAPLPLDRINNSLVFETTGIDLAGPLFLKERNKAYIVLFTCAVYRAVHLEIVLSLSTESFLCALRRFISRRGRVVTIYTDNGTNFVGSSNLLRRLKWEKIVEDTSVRRIIWKFNPPSAAWWGGWWERLVGMVKQLLRRNIGKSLLTYEELSTILCDCEATLNARPLTYISSDDDSLHPLSPSLFLQPLVTSDVPDIDAVDSSSLNKRVRYIQRLRKGLRERFQKEYLAMLVHKGKNPKSPDICIGDVVLLGDGNVKRIKWPLAIVLELYPGKDGNTRVAKIRTNSGEFIRPLQRLYPLELKSDYKEVLSRNPNIQRRETQEKLADEMPECKKMVRRSGRKIKQVQKLSLFTRTD